MRHNNRHALKGLQYIVDKDPDVICLQEANNRAVKFLEDHGYKSHVIDDSEAKNPRKAQFIATFTKLEVDGQSVFEYNSEKVSSLLFNGYKILGFFEKNNSLLTTIDYNGRILGIINLRLSAAAVPGFRIQSIKNIIDNFSDMLDNLIICGDLNVIEWKIFKAATGWVRSYKKYDYKVNEHKEINSLLDQAGLINNFSGLNTTFFNPKGIKVPPLQLDHIITGPGVKVGATEVLKKMFGSDHRMLSIELDV